MPDAVKNWAFNGDVAADDLTKAITVSKSHVLSRQNDSQSSGFDSRRFVRSVPVVFCFSRDRCPRPRRGKIGSFAFLRLEANIEFILYNPRKINVKITLPRTAKILFFWCMWKILRRQNLVRNSCYCRQFVFGMRYLKSTVRFQESQLRPGNIFWIM